MMNINLIPWRKARKQYEHKRIIMIVCGTNLIAIIIVAAIYFVLDYKQGKIQSAIDICNEEVKSYSGVETLDARMQATAANLISTMQHYFLATQNIITQLGKISQYEICFTEITRKNKQIKFFGATRSMADLTNFLEGWKKAQLFSDIRIEHVTHDKKLAILQFQLSALENIPEDLPQ